jgi:bifunctional non-homologous end joining protein LigD
MRSCVNLTNLDKIYWEKEEITKGELLEYYRSMAPTLLPYLKNRPLVLHRFPEGIKGESFYQKDLKKPYPSFIKTFPIKHENKIVSYALIQNLQSLLYVVNLGSIELHIFNASVKHLLEPDYLVFDLDPEGVSFHAVIDVAQLIHELLEGMKVAHFCKTSGVRGLHVYVPLHAQYDYHLVKQFAYLFALVAAQRLPHTISLERRPQKRQKKVYIDYLQNQKMLTMICPYSVRATVQATVSMPLLWKEVKYGLDPREFTLRTALKRVKQTGDPFKGVLGRGIPMQKCLSQIKRLVS